MCGVGQGQNGRELCHVKCELVLGRFALDRLFRVTGNLLHSFV